MGTPDVTKHVEFGYEIDLSDAQCTVLEQALDVLGGDGVDWTGRPQRHALPFETAFGAPVPDNASVRVLVYSLYDAVRRGAGERYPDVGGPPDALDTLEIEPIDDPATGRTYLHVQSRPPRGSIGVAAELTAAIQEHFDLPSMGFAWTSRESSHQRGSMPHSADGGVVRCQRGFPVGMEATLRDRVREIVPPTVAVGHTRPDNWRGYNNLTAVVVHLSGGEIQGPKRVHHTLFLLDRFGMGLSIPFASAKRLHRIELADYNANPIWPAEDDRLCPTHTVPGPRGGRTRVWRSAPDLEVVGAVGALSQDSARTILAGLTSARDVDLELASTLHELQESGLPLKSAEAEIRLRMSRLATEENMGRAHTLLDWLRKGPGMEPDETVDATATP